MSWEERQQAARYVSPSGAEFPLIVTEVSVEFDKRATEYQFPDVDGSYIVDLGVSGRRYPMQIIFNGENYDLFANAFEVALAERGIGRLHHPVYGTVDVVVMGTIARADNLVSGCNQCTFNVTFFTTTGAAYPVIGSDGFAQVKTALQLLSEALAADLESKADLTSEAKRSGFSERYRSQLQRVRGAFEKVAAANKATSDRFNNVYRSIDESLDILVGDPVTLAFQTSILVDTPGQMAGSFSDKIAGYRSLLSGLIDGDSKVQTDGNGRNNFANDDLFAGAVQSGAIQASIGNEYTSKTEALLQAEAILDDMDSINTWREANFSAIGGIDAGGTYQALIAASSTAAGYLLYLSFALAQEYSVSLSRARTIIDLCAELYRDIDGAIDFFINTNDLSGDEILEIPKGRQIVYFR